MDIEAIVLTPEQLARYHGRFLPGAPAVTEAGLRRHADVHGAYMVAETAWDHGLKAPVPVVPAPSQSNAPRKRRRRKEVS